MSSNSDHIRPYHLIAILPHENRTKWRYQGSLEGIATILDYFDPSFEFQKGLAEAKAGSLL